MILLTSSLLLINIFKEQTTTVSKKKNTTLTTYNKTPGSVIIFYPSTEEEIKKIKLKIKTKTVNNNDNKKQKRDLAFINIGDDKKEIDINDRIIIGTANSIDRLTIINRVNPKWRELLANNLLRYQPEDSKVIITNEHSVLKLIEKNRAQNLEHVLINYILANGRTSSFEGYADSESGELLKTWNREVHHKKYDPPLTVRSK